MTARQTAEGARSQDSWLTVADVAAQQQVHPKTVLRWISNGRLPATRIGRHWRISQQQLDRMLDGDH